MFIGFIIAYFLMLATKVIHCSLSFLPLRTQPQGTGYSIEHATPV